MGSNYGRCGLEWKMRRRRENNKIVEEGNIVKKDSQLSLTISIESLI